MPPPDDPELGEAYQRAAAELLPQIMVACTSDDKGSSRLTFVDLDEEQNALDLALMQALLGAVDHMHKRHVIHQVSTEPTSA